MAVSTQKPAPSMEREALMLGEPGSQIISGTGVNTGLNVGCIVPLADVVFTTLTGNCTGAAGPTFPKGVPIMGIFTVITLASGGPVMAYNR